jgi:DNA-binding IclR family transcriptional regulator
MQPIERALRLLQYVVLERQAIGTRESARFLEISPSSAHRLLKTLVGLGFLKQDETTSEFSPGLELYRLAAALLASNALSQAARAPMERLAAQTDEPVCLCLRHGGNRIVLDTIRSSRQLQYAPPLGHEMPLHAGSSGLAVLAWLPDEEVEAFIEKGLARFTDTTITEPKELRRALQTIRSQGFAISYGHYLNDGAGVSAPIFGLHGEVLGSLLISIPVSRLEEHGSLEALGQVVRELAEEISLRLGGHR